MSDAYVIRNRMPRAPSGAGARGGVVARGVLLAAAVALATAGFADASTKTPTKVATKMHTLAPSSPPTPRDQMLSSAHD